MDKLENLHCRLYTQTALARLDDDDNINVRSLYLVRCPIFKSDMLWKCHHVRTEEQALGVAQDGLDSDLCKFPQLEASRTPHQEWGHRRSQQPPARSAGRNKQSRWIIYDKNLVITLIKSFSTAFRPSPLLPTSCPHQSEQDNSTMTEKKSSLSEDDDDDDDDMFGLR